MPVIKRIARSSWDHVFESKGGFQYRYGEKRNTLAWEVYSAVSKVIFAYNGEIEDDITLTNHLEIARNWPLFNTFSEVPASTQNDNHDFLLV